MKSIKDNDVWDLVPLRPGREAVRSQWVYKVKAEADGIVQQYKARLVTQGYTPKFGDSEDYDETFCLVIRQEYLCVLMGLSVPYGLAPAAPNGCDYRILKWHP